MPDNGNTDYEGVARLTVNLIDHRDTPNEVSDAVLESLIVMADDSRINIWHRETGLSVESLATLYRMYQTGAGYRRSRLYAHYEIGRKERESDNGQS